MVTARRDPRPRAVVPTPTPALVPPALTTDPGAGEAKEQAVLAAAEAEAIEQAPASVGTPEAPIAQKAPAEGVAADGLYLQVGAFGDPKNAERLRRELEAERARRSPSGPETPPNEIASRDVEE